MGCVLHLLYLKKKQWSQNYSLLYLKKCISPWGLFRFTVLALENIYSVKRSDRSTVCVCGGMWLVGITPLYRVTNNLTSIQYVTNVLEGTMLPYVTAEFPAIGPVVFVQDKYNDVVFRVD